MSVVQISLFKKASKPGEASMLTFSMTRFGWSKDKRVCISPTSPGLGVDLKEDVLAAYPYIDPSTL